MKILVTDDSAAIRRQLVKILHELGIEQVQEAASVDEGMAYLAKNPDTDLVFSDWHMPRLTGLDFLKWVRSQPELQLVKFVILTTEQEKAKILEAARIGLQGYLFKPVQKDVISQRLASLGFAVATA